MMIRPWPRPLWPELRDEPTERKMRSNCRSVCQLLGLPSQQRRQQAACRRPTASLLATNPSRQMPPQLVAIVVPFVRSTRRHSSLAARCACATGRSDPPPHRCHPRAIRSTTCQPCGCHAAHGGFHSFRKSTSTIGNDNSALVRSALPLGSAPASSIQRLSKRRSTTRFRQFNERPFGCRFGMLFRCRLPWLLPIQLIDNVANGLMLLHRLCSQIRTQFHLNFANSRVFSVLGMH